MQQVAWQPTDMANCYLFITCALMAVCVIKCDLHVIKLRASGRSYSLVSEQQMEMSIS